MKFCIPLCSNCLGFVLSRVHDNPLLRPTAKTWRNALIEAENALVICAVNNQHRYGKHMNACPWCERTLALSGRDPFPSLQAVKTGQHLQPIKPKRVIPLVKTSLLPTKRTLSTQLPLLATNPANKRSSPFVLGLIGIAVLGCLEVLVVVNTPNPITDSIATSFPKTNNVASPNSATNSGNGSVADYHQSYEAAIENSNRLLRLNPNDAKAYLQRGNAHYEIARHSGNRDRDYKAAIDDFNQALRLNPRLVEAYLNRGIIHYEVALYSGDSDREYKAAIDDFNQALRLNPRLVEAYLNRGIVRYEIALYSGDSDRDYKAAIDDFSQVLRLNPHSAEAYFKRGTVRYELAPHSTDADRDYKAAIEDLHKAAKLFLEQGDRDHYQQVLAVCQREKLDNIKSCQ